MNKNIGQKIVLEMLKGYGEKFSIQFPTLENLFAVQPTPEEVTALEMPIPGLGRYRKNTAFLKNVTSAKATGLARFHIIKEYLFAFSKLMAKYSGPHRKMIPGLSDEDIEFIRNNIGVTVQEVHLVDVMEIFSEHDTAAAGDLMMLEIASLKKHLASYIGAVCFATTSEDIMGNAFGLTANELVFHHFIPKILDFCDFLIDDFVKVHSPQDKILLIPEFTHEQTAEWTTPNQKITVRLNAILDLMADMQYAHVPDGSFHPFAGKFGGPIGDLKCHKAAYPDIDWKKFAREFVEGLGLHYHAFTDQCVPYTTEAQHFRTIINILTQIIKLADDFVKMVRCPAQIFVKVKGEGHKGSSIMPNKSNLWQIEGAIAMLMETCAMLNFLAETLQKYPDAGNMMRSYLFRNIGAYFMPSFIALGRIKREMSQCRPNPVKIQAFFEEYPGMFGSLIQVVLKRGGIAGDAYRLVQKIAFNADSTYANAEQFKTGLEQVMKELRLAEPLCDELRAFFSPSNSRLIELIGDGQDTSLASMSARIQLFRQKAQQIKGLPKFAA
ncbi:hypothetical protein COT99_03515 [Candidatus Falkowbacteria bacterium CG10_big_fil_rev_8_21_14_0_10_43_10]|uniref:Fumarate lyase N-terminal domain-containing protein n=1 Tax=Candidatus Falkowbacteria bacterium CG10_big_fil_rev_8_21_14_0_10_43_10 TaxID=1974567 RepID=A0A2H0V1G2_9BACT|nr:MAG: hypothetical protein COT99_03515 [Candidatus Falkowbacteria bacterium CG10_big_fil_rev_8_21_14_0_10_43_10]